MQQLLREAGYTTAMIGKWHLVSEPTGFDYWNILTGQGDYYNPVFIDNGEKKTIRGYATNITTDIALDWLESGRDIDGFVQNIDHAPTFLELAGAAVPDDIQGESYLPLLEGRHRGWRKSLYYHYYEYPAEHCVRCHYGVRTTRMKCTMSTDSRAREESRNG